MPEFSRAILTWYAANRRDLPWRRTTDPYAILVSETMLQQTQVDRVIPKYAAWLARFPRFAALAAAPRSDVLKLWSGLGYNSRAVRLHALAQLLVEQHGGRLPSTEEELARLPGIGPYTAGALMVFAHNRPGSCVDVNVERIVRRVFFPGTAGTAKARTSKNKKIITNKRITRKMITTEIITKSGIEKAFLDSFPPGRAADYGNALMDFGSAVCTAAKPRCAECPVYATCRSKGERPDEKNLRAKKQQPAFLHSNRWWRGQILKAVNENGRVSAKDSLRMIIARPKKDEKEAFRNALKQLREEGLLSRGKTIRVND